MHVLHWMWAWRSSWWAECPISPQNFKLPTSHVLAFSCQWCLFHCMMILVFSLQVLSLSLEGNLKPKYLYLVNELRNEVKSLTKYPTYLSLSLEQRIRPRHRFLVSLKKVPKGPFPLSSFVPTDECFCHQWAGTSLEKYLAFRQTFLLSDFGKKYERKKIIEPHLSS